VPGAQPLNGQLDRRSVAARPVDVAPQRLVQLADIGARQAAGPVDAYLARGGLPAAILM
jgi:hypothetical protein